MKKNITFIIFFFLFLPLFSCKSHSKVNYQEGDLIFQESKSRQSRYVKLITGSRYTHMGILFKIKGKWFVYEAAQPVTYTPLMRWIARGKNKHFIIKRLKHADTLISTKTIKKMKKTGRMFYKKDYDYLFQWSDKRIYCSELVWKIYKRSLNLEIGSLQKFKDFDLSHPDIKRLIRKRYGKNISLAEKVITPVRMFESDKLVTVFNN